MDLTLFYFWFSFLFSFILDLGKEYDVILYVMAIQVTEYNKNVKT